MRGDPRGTSCALGIAFLAIVGVVLSFGAVLRVIIGWLFFP